MVVTVLKKPAWLIESVSPWQNTKLVGAGKLVESETSSSVTTLMGRTSNVGRGRSSGTGLA